MVDRAGARVLIVAGEASGDRHAARLVRALAARVPVEVRGVGGPALRSAGAATIVDMSDVNVLGFSGVVRRLPTLLRALRRVRAEAAAFRPHAAVLVDSPGLNFRLGPALRRAGVPVFYYIAPQVWAWHAERARQMAAWVNRLAVVFPFEEPLFRAAGVDATFVGHPLLEDLEPEVDAATLRHELGAGFGAPIVGLLPGSRAQELHAHVPALLGAAGRLTAAHPDLVAALPLAPGLEPAALAVGGVRIEAAGDRLRAVGRDGAAWVLHGRTRAVMAHATACAVASGTATLETALFATPLAVIYRVGAMNYWIARRLVRLERIGLPNIVAGADVAPELLQGDCTPDRIAATLAPWLADPAARARVRAGLAIVRERLGTPGASARAAAALLPLLG